MQQGDQRPSGAQGADDDDTHRRIKQHLADHVGDLGHSVDIINDLALAVEFVRQADYLIISAGAGLSASVGLDYTSEAVFARLYPAMHALGFRCMYQFIGRLPIPEELKWGYLLTHAHRARFTWGPTELYTQLLRLAEQTGQGSDSSGGGGRYFVKTSNADGFFEQSGFDMSRVFTPQGDYGNMQCLSQECNDKAAAGSAPVVFPTRPFVDAALPHIDTNETMQITEPSAMPRCPRCSGPVFFNVRGGDWFIESPYHAAGQAYRRFVEQAIAECSRDDVHAEDPDPAPEKERKKSPGTVVILEIGAGFNTPGVLRWPNERLLARHDCVRLVRLNPDYPEVPQTNGPLRAVGLPLDAAAVVPLFLKHQQQ